MMYVFSVSTTSACVFLSMYLHTHTHTHTYIYIYIHTYIMHTVREVEDAVKGTRAAGEAEATPERSAVAEVRIEPKHTNLMFLCISLFYVDMRRDGENAFAQRGGRGLD